MLPSNFTVRKLIAMMPPCGTFHYAGVVPERRLDIDLGLWILSDQSGAEPASPSPDVPYNELRGNRLVGLQPIAQISGAEFILRARSGNQATIRTASIALDQFLLEELRPGDRVELVRTASANIAVSVMRAGELYWALGAVTVVPLGPSLRIRGGPERNAGDEWPRKDTWLDVSAESETVRLRDHEEVNLGPYRLTVLRSFRDTIPGSYENVVVSTDATGIHEAAIRAAMPYNNSVYIKMVQW